MKIGTDGSNLGSRFEMLRAFNETNSDKGIPVSDKVTFIQDIQSGYSDKLSTIPDIHSRFGQLMHFIGHRHE
ncbi:hypothetical protein H0266_15685 [Halobacillus locisalis]|uniref:Uncharacterized protein n=1 Tax=Halobacillus locisalis TaxID=220753 RepID=A0A838CWN1_9BACI|nr:hypothetical protein [Halobacillus locisalis]MBA2176338.1 hypothetical protein [Halobacillus locisalis]